MNRPAIEILADSQIYKDYEKAFSQTTGMPLSLRAVNSWQLPYNGKPCENRLCAQLAKTSKACAACLQVQERLAGAAAHSAQTMKCKLGMTESAVPIHAGEQLVGYLTTGQVFTKKPTSAEFNRAASMLSDWGVGGDHAELEKAYFATKVVTPQEQASAVKMLDIFAEHLSMVSNAIVIQAQNSELPAIAKAKAYIANNMSEDLSLAQVAKAVNMSTFYFCKTFKREVGISFTDYVSRTRIEKAKNLLLNPNLRISEIAYEVGFQSLTHFNRMFKKIVGNSPTEYRASLTA